MTIEVKSGPVLKIKSLNEAGEIEGYGSTFGGEADCYGDIVEAGAFAKTLAAHAAKGTAPKMLWQHRMSAPIGIWTEAREDDKGLFLRGKLFVEQVQQAREAYALLKGGAIDGLSIGYSVTRYESDPESGIWYLKELDLQEVSIVTIGANENATVFGVKAAKQRKLKTDQLIARIAAGERLTEREFEDLAKGTWGLSNSQAERAARIHLKGQGDPADADTGMAFLRALTA
jgi:HK97 family phage prohead protease